MEMKMEKKMEKKLISIGLAAIFVIGVFAGIMGIASAQTYYNETGKYIEGINVTVNTSVAFNRSCINVPLMFLINNTLNESATSFNVTVTTPGLTTNATAVGMVNDTWFWVNATEADTYWVNVSNKENSSEYVYFTVEYLNITIEIKPETLNLRSKGLFTVFFTNFTAINISTLKCEGASPVKEMIDGDRFIAKFNRQDLRDDLRTGDAVTLTVTGELKDGTPFECKDTIRVKNKGILDTVGSVLDRWLNGVKNRAERAQRMFSASDDDAIARIQVDKGAQPKVPVIIGFKDKPSQADKNKIRGHSGDIKHSYTIINAIAAKLPEQAIDKIKKNPRVAYVEMDGEVHALDIELNNSWGVKRIGAGTVHAENKGTGVKVAILDTGIDYSHSDLNANYKGGHDFANGDSDPMDDNGHGTHCAGIVAAENNGEGVVGVAPEACLSAVKVLDSGGSGYLSDVIAGIDWSVRNGMQVISMSLGTDTDYQSLHDACDAAYAAGIVVVAAAGNDGTPPGKGDNVDYPGAYSSVIAVAATDSNDERARWSSTGPAVELAAPGVSIYSTYPEGYATKSGTSMACPHVSGTAALVIASDSSLSNVEVRLRLQETADDLGATGFDTKYGYGLVDADEDASQPDTTPPVPTNTLHVARINMSTDNRSAGPKNTFVWAVATVTIVDKSGISVEGATVSGHWSELTSDTDSGTTDSDGKIALNSDSVKNADGTFTFTVTGVERDGWIYDSDANKETSDSITA